MRDEYGNPECKGCFYSSLAGRYRVCDYFLITGKRRPCPPDVPCTVKEVRTEVKSRAPLEIHAGGRRRDPLREQQWRELHEQGLSDRQIAERTGVAQPTVSNWRRSVGLEVNKTAQRAVFEDRLALYNKGMSDRQIAKALGITSVSVLKWRKRNGLPALYKQGGGGKIDLEG